MKKVLRSMFRLLRSVKLLFHYATHSSNYFGQSYFPEKKHKSKCRIFFEQCSHILRYGEINSFYYVYGLDVCGESFKHKDLMAYNEFAALRNKRNYTTPYSYVCLLRNKEYFSMVANFWGYRCASNIGVFDPEKNQVVFPNKEVVDVLSLLKSRKDLFLKPCDAECGQGVFSLCYKEDKYYINDIVATEEDVLEQISSLRETYLVQQRLSQHEDMNRIYPLSVNTLRITTITNTRTGHVELFHSLLRVGAFGNVVDNWAKGGLIMSVNNDGTLSAEGYFKPGYGTITTEHPDTHIEFKGFTVPFYELAVEMCLSFHKDLKYIPAIGWDVAISADGPIFIEGNDNWEISMHQIFGGQKKRFESLLK